MRNESPAIQMLRRQIEDVITSLRLEHLKVPAMAALDSLRGMVNADAAMTEEQADSVQTYIIDYMASRDCYPPFPERAMIATYINSCKP